MARFALKDYISIGCSDSPTATTWEVALDPEFTQIIDRSVEDKVNIYNWNSPLPMIGSDDFYSDLDALYLRVKVHINDTVSPWFVAVVKNQNDQTVRYVENDEIIETANSLEIGMN